MSLCLRGLEVLGKHVLRNLLKHFSPRGGTDGCTTHGVAPKTSGLGSVVRATVTPQGGRFSRTAIYLPTSFLVWSDVVCAVKAGPNPHRSRLFDSTSIRTFANSQKRSREAGIALTAKTDNVRGHASSQIQDKHRLMISLSSY